MSKNIIIGAGFSACLTKILIGSDTKVVGLKSNNIGNNFLRRKSIESNKFFSKKAYSHGTLKFKLHRGTFQDRLILGGNSSIWGGNFNLQKIPNYIINKLKKNNIYFKKLSYNTTGTISNNVDIVQLQSNDNKILKPETLSIKIQNGYLLKFIIKKKNIHLNFDKNKNKKVKKLLLCTGDIQLLDLLYRSNFIKENDLIEYSEFHSEFKLNNIFSRFNKKIITVRFLFARAIGHFLGIQYYSKYLKILNFIPLCVDQNFYKKKINYQFKIKKGTVVQKNNNKYFFGKSAHYCNLRINGLNINKFLSKIHPNIIGVGMSFVNQKKPGPISNDILLDINRKLIVNK